MSTETTTVLKSYFQTGQVPTESHFSDLIDSYYNKAEGGIVSKGTLNKVLAGTVTLELNFPNKIIGTGTEFTKQLWHGAPLKIGDNIFTVASINSETELIITPEATTAINPQSAETSGNLLTTQDRGGNDLCYIDPLGNVKATGFNGSGANLADISANNITMGTLPLSILPEDMPAAKISGTLSNCTISAENITGNTSSKNILFYTETPYPHSASGLSLNWVADTDFTLSLSYILNGKLQTQSLNPPVEGQVGSTTLSVSEDTVFTLTAKKSSVVVAQKQVAISFVSPIQSVLNAYVNTLKTTTPSIEINTVIRDCAASFPNLQGLIMLNLSLLVLTLKKASFTNSAITTALSNYYHINSSNPHYLEYQEVILQALGE